METAPPRIISSAQTVANTGLFMKKSTTSTPVHSDCSSFPVGLRESRRPQRLLLLLRALQLLNHRHAILQKLQPGQKDVIARLDTVQHNVIVSYSVANLQQTLPRHGRALIVFHRQESKKLTADARDRQNRNHCAFARRPYHLRPHLL